MANPFIPMPHEYIHSVGMALVEGARLEGRIAQIELQLALQDNSPKNIRDLYQSRRRLWESIFQRESAAHFAYADAVDAGHQLAQQWRRQRDVAHRYSSLCSLCFFSKDY